LANRLASAKAVENGVTDRMARLASTCPKGVYFDYEANQGGGVLYLIAREIRGDHRDAIEWLHADISSRTSPDNTKRERAQQKFRLLAAVKFKLSSNSSTFAHCKYRGGKAL
jgi:hypothetical protein